MTLTTLMAVFLLVPSPVLTAHLIPTYDLTTLEGLKEYIAYKAENSTVEASMVEKVIQCESRWNTKARGDSGDSVGLAQINLPSHPLITLEQAFDPKFSIDFMFSEWEAGRASAWTCYRLLK